MIFFWNCKEVHSFAEYSYIAKYFYHKEYQRKKKWEILTLIPTNVWNFDTAGKCWIGQRWPAHKAGAIWGNLTVRLGIIHVALHQSDLHLKLFKTLYNEKLII